MKATLLTPQDLATRWFVTLSTLGQWRWNGRGPQFLKIGGRVLYQIQDVEAFEEQARRANTSKQFTALNLCSNHY